MKFFACVLDTAGRGISDEVRRRVQSMPINRLLPYRWDTFPGAAVLTGWDEFGGEISIERYRDWLIVGLARLDNRPELERKVRADGSWSDDESDLALVVRLIAHAGTAAIPSLLGEFGFIAWHATTRSAIGASDAFDLAPLYYTQHGGLTLVGSRAEPLSMTDRYDIAYLGDMLTVDSATQNRTVYAGVAHASAGSTLTVRDGRVATDLYWSPVHVATAAAEKISEADAIEICRDLLTTSIRLRLDPRGGTWSQLSGGIDSSSVVSVAQWLVEQGKIAQGLDGTLTFVIGSQTGSDERSFSDPIVKRWGIRNEVVVDAPMWYDGTDETVLPLPDQPLLTIIHAPIDCRFRTILREARARVLLTGWGSDQLFTGSMIYLADRLVRGQVSPVFGELAHRAALGRLSFWKLAYEHAVKPFVPASLRRLGQDRFSPIPSWLRTDTLAREDIARKPDYVSDGPIGHKYRHWHASGVVETQRGDETRALAEVVSLRHPFLYRPLVEFALRLPPELCSRPRAHKWVLREAMKGILPDVVRTRVGKGGGGDSFARMFIHQQALLKQLARNPLMAELGLVDARRLEEAVEGASNPLARQESIQADIIKTLAIEAWLQVRSGRWPRGFAMSQAPAVPRQDTYQLTATQRRPV